MRIVAIGLGRFGSDLAATHTDLGHDVLAVDVSERAVHEEADILTKAA